MSTDARLLEAVLSETDEHIAVYGLDSTVVYMNPANERTLGLTLADARGKRLFDLFPGAIGNPFHVAFVQVADTGEPVQFDHYYPPFDRWFANRIVRLGEHIVVFAREITEDVRRRRRLATLAQIADVLTRGERDTRVVAGQLAAIMATELAAECTIARLSADRQLLEPLAQSYPHAETHAIIATVQRWNAHVGITGEALRTRRSVLRLSGFLDDVPADETTMREGVTRYQPGSVLVAPLLAGDDTIGVLVASRREGGPQLTEHDRVLAAEVAPTIALYLSNAAHDLEASALRNRLTAMTDALPALASFIDRDERYHYVNAAYERWFGRPRSDYIGRTMRENLGERAYAVLAPHVREVLAGRPVHFRSRVEYPNGVRDIDAHYVPIRAADGAVDGFAVLVHDVSAEVRLAEVERRHLDDERRATRRLESLLALTSRLAGATTRADIARALIDGGTDALDSPAATLYQASADGTALELVHERGLDPALRPRVERIPLTLGAPVTEAFQANRPVFKASRAEYAQEFPEAERHFRDTPGAARSLAALPLSTGGRVRMVMAFVFDQERSFTTDERTYLELLASHGAEALRRTDAYAELHDLTELQSAMIQSSPGAIILLDSTGVVRSWNQGAERIFGWKASEVIGAPMPVGDDPVFDANLAAVLAGQELLHLERARRRADGEVFSAEIFAAPVRLSDGRTMCVAMVFDITERKRVERGRQLVTEVSSRLVRTLERAEALDAVVRLPLDVMADWCCVDLLEDDVLHRVALSDAHAAPGIAVARTLAHDGSHEGISRAIVERAPQLWRDVDDALLRRMARDDVHLAALRAHGMKSYLSVPLMFADRILGALTFASRSRNFDDLDIALASELATHAAAAIENARLFDLANKARSDAEAANRAKDEFLAILGHELRNPLAPLVTALELMEMRGDTLFARERAVLGRQITHLSRLVDDLLDVSRITRGKVELRRERVSLGDVIAKAIEQTSPLLDEKRHHLMVEVPPDLAVDGDPTRLAQIVANLMANAAKYTPAGGQITVIASRAGRDATLEVRDNGIGIARDMLPRVFDLFAQAPQSSARPAGGLGLGLTIVRSLAELHGGRVTADSEGPNRGSTFTVTLPAAGAQPVVTTAEDAPRAARAAAPRRILVVDDNEDAALLLADLLDAHGHEIRTAFDGPSALRIADEFRPEIAVLDIGLPVMDGYELAARLRASPQLQPLRLIAVTGYGQDSDRARSREAGFAAHLAKPIQIEALVDLVEKR